jgi:hypothetical protein
MLMMQCCDLHVLVVRRWDKPNGRSEDLKAEVPTTLRWRSVGKYTGVLAAADVKAFVHSTTFMILHSTRLDFGPSLSFPLM